MRVEENKEKRLLTEVWAAIDREYIEEERQKQGGGEVEAKLNEAKDALTNASIRLHNYIYDRQRVH